MATNVITITIIIAIIVYIIYKNKKTKQSSIYSYNEGSEMKLPRSILKRSLSTRY